MSNNKMRELRAIRTLRGDRAATQEILRVLKKTSGNMGEACKSLGVGKSSMYRLIKDLGAAVEIDRLIAELGVKIQGKILTEQRQQVAAAAEAAKGPRVRVRKVAA